MTTKVYTYSNARSKLSRVLEESKTNEVIIMRRKGDMFAITPKAATVRSPFDLASSGLKTGITLDEILDTLHESRAMSYKRQRTPRRAK